MARKASHFMRHLIFWPIAIMAWFSPVFIAKAETFNAVVFSYGLNYIEQTIDVSDYAGQISSLIITPSVMSTQGGPDKVGTAFEVKDSSDQQLLSINMDGASLADTDSSWFEASVSADIDDSSSWSTLTIRIWGKDAENWGGNYGPMIRSVSVQAKLNQNTEWTDLSSLITNPDFSSVTDYAPDGWSSDQTWDACQGLSSATLCVGTIEVQSATPPSTTTTTTVPPTTTTTLPPTQQGLEYWAFSSQGGSPTEPSDKSGAISSGWVEGLDMNWSGGQILDTGRSDGVILWFEGFIQPSTAGIYDLYICSDDGMRLRLDGELVIDNWFDRGTSCSQPYSADFSNGQPKAIKVSWYENGGGAAVILRYKDASNSIVTVPFSWYYYGGTPSSNSPSTTTTTTTTVPQSIGAPLNLTVTEIETGFFLDWDEPTEGNVSPERYAVSWSVEGMGGWGWATGNVGDENALITEITIPYDILESTGGLDQTYVFSVRSDNDSLSMYSSWSNNIELLVSAPTTTTTPPPTTTTPPPTTTTVPPTTTTTPPAPVVAPPPVTSAAPTTAPTTIAPTTSTTPTTSLASTTNPITSLVATTVSTVASTIATSIPNTTGGPVESTQPTTQAPTTTINATTTTTAPSQSSVPQPAPDGENEEPTPQIPVDANVEEMTEIIEQSSPQAIVLIVDSFIDDGVTEDEALAVVVSSIALQAITEDQAHEIFAELNTDALSDAEVIQVIESVQEAPEEIRNQFEDTIDIFSEGVFDTYIPVGSSITVGQRRAIIAVSAVTSVIASAPVSGGSQRRRGTK